MTTLLHAINAAPAQDARPFTASIATTRSSDGRRLRRNQSLDVAVAFAALDATVVVRGVGGIRAIPFRISIASQAALPSATTCQPGDSSLPSKYPDGLRAALRTTSRFAIANPSNSRSYPWQSPLRLMESTSVRRGLQWAGSHPSPGAWRMPKLRLRGVSLDGIDALGWDRVILRRCTPPRAQRFQGRACPARCLACAANRGRTQVSAVGQPISRANGRLKVTGRQPIQQISRLQTRRTPPSPTARSQMAGSIDRIVAAERRRACWRSSPTAICRA